MRWLSLGFLLACGGSGEKEEGGEDTAATTEDSDPTGGTGGGTGTSAEFPISAAEGGTVEFGGATLVIPPGSLSADTTLTVSVGEAPADGTTFSDVFDFGPDGTTFDPPAELSLAIGSVPSGQEVAVQWFDEVAGAWVTLPTTVSGGVAVASVAHFTTFAVRVVGGPPGLDVCAPPAPCGGDPTGAWRLAGFCFESEEKLDGCPTGRVEVSVEASGDYDFQAGGAFSYDIELTFASTIYFPAECVVGLTCDEIDLGCRDDGAGGCICNGEDSKPLRSSGAGTWAVEGTELLIDEGGEVDRVPFCIDEGIFWGIDEDDEVIYALTR